MKPIPDEKAPRTLALVAAILLATTGCSFVFSDANYIDNDAELPFDTGVGDVDGAPDGAVDGDGPIDGATGCLADPTLCTEGTRCGADGRCVACDADGDGSYAEGATCDALAGGDPRDCDDDDGAVHPGAAPVCGDGKINGCDAGPPALLAALAGAEIGSIGEERRAPVAPGDDLWSLGLDVVHGSGAGGPRVVMTWATETSGGRFAAIDPESLSAPVFLGLGVDVVSVDVRRVTDTDAVIMALARDASGTGLLISARYSTTAPTTLSRSTYAFDDGPCASGAEAAELVGDLSVDGTGAATWLLGGSDRALYVTDAFDVACVAVPAGAHRSAGSDGPVVGFVDPMDGRWRAFRGPAEAVDDISAAPADATRDERPGFAFLRAAAADLHLGASVNVDGRTRIVPVECASGGACSASVSPQALFDPATGVAATYGAALDALAGDFAALVQIEERPTAPAPDDRSHDVVLRVLEYPNRVVGGDGAGAPGQGLLLHRHGYQSADRDHAEVREVAVATTRDPATGDLTAYWAALVGDRRLAPGSTDDPAAENEIRYGGVRVCVND